MIDFCINWISVIWEFATKVFYFVPERIWVEFTNTAYEGVPKVIYTLSMVYFIFILILPNDDLKWDKWDGFYTLGAVLAFFNIIPVITYSIVIFFSLALFAFADTIRLDIVKLFNLKCDDKLQTRNYKYNSVLRKLKK